jgi:hypothetical protein
MVGTSDVVVFGNSFSSSMNYAPNSSGVLCEFASVFETIEQFDSFTPLCIEATSDNCARYETPMPSVAPIEAPPASSPTMSVPTTTTSFPSASAFTPTAEGGTASPSAPVDFVFPETNAPGSGGVQIVRNPRATVMTIGMSAVFYSFML